MDIEKKIWEDRIFPNFQDNLVIHFEMPVWDKESEYEVSVKIFWKKNINDTYIPKKILVSKPCTIQTTFQNGILIKGTLQIKKFSNFGSKDTLGIFADFYYYAKENGNYLWHTEGFLVSFEPKLPVVKDIITTVAIIDEPVIQKAENNVPAAVNPTVTSGTYSDLFPYIYVTGWPKITTPEKISSFFTYTIPVAKSPPAAYAFTDKLVQLKAANSRTAMQMEAVLFLEGVSPYELQYVNQVTQLTGYIGRFLPYYNDLTNTANLVTVVEKTCIFFGTDVETFSAYLKNDIYLDDKQLLWESYFALIIEMGYESDNLENIIKVLTLCNFLEIVFNNLNDTQSATILSQTTLSYLFRATIILYPEIFPLPPYSLSPPAATDSILLPYAIGNLHLVKYKLLRYEVGELASITSIMPGEKRKLVNRKLDRVIDKEINKTISITESVTVNTEQNNDFNEELWNAIAETTETTNYPSPGMTTTYGPPTNITVSGSYTKQHTTQTPDNKQLSSFAKKVLNKTTQRLSEKINKVRAHTELKESEDISVSLLNNVNNNQAVYGIYCWLNKIYQAKVVNYGNRMLFSFIIEHPAADYISQAKVLDENDLEEPKTLEQFGVYTYQDISVVPDAKLENSYLNLCQYYRLKNFPLPPQETIVVSDIVGLSQSKLIPLPKGYYADSANIYYAFGTGQIGTVSGFIGQNSFTFSPTATSPTGSKEFSSLKDEQNEIAVGTVYNPSIQMSPPDSELDFQMSVEISSIPLAQTILLWQINMYQLLLDAYTEQLAIYKLKTDSSATGKEIVNPLAERLTIKQALEKSIRKQLLENALQVSGLPLSLINSPLSATSQYNQAEIIQYLNMALEWDEMSYTFFDEYDSQNGVFAISSLSPDFFSAFLKAGYAKVIIPIPPAFNYGFLYFLNTGAVWNITDDLAPCFQDNSNDITSSPDQMSIVYELKKTFHTVSHKTEIVDEWEVLIPTSMQILQDKKNLNIKTHESYE